MRGLRIVFVRLVALFRDRHADRDLRAHIDAHLDEAVGEYVQQGFSHEEVRRVALLSVGGVAQAQEMHRDVRSFAWLEDANPGD